MIIYLLEQVKKSYDNDQDFSFDYYIDKNSNILLTMSMNKAPFTSYHEVCTSDMDELKDKLIMIKEWKNQQK